MQLAPLYHGLGSFSQILINLNKLSLDDQGWGAVSYSSLSITQVKIYSTRYLHFVIILLDKVHDYRQFLLSCQIKVNIKLGKSMY